MGGGGRGRGRGGQGGTPNFQGLNGAMVGQLNAQDLGDQAPTAAMLTAFGASCRDLAKTVAAYQKIAAEAGGMKPAVQAPSGVLKPPAC
jgi:hypothetical protein